MVGSVRIFIDAVGFPNVEMILDAVGGGGVEIFIVGNYTQNLGRFDDLAGVKVVEVSEGSDMADFAIITEIKKGDMLLTSDIGLASIALDKGALVLGPRGDEFTADTIDLRLQQRHEANRKRRSGGRSRGPKKLSDEDRLRFREKLRSMMERFF